MHTPILTETLPVSFEQANWEVRCVMRHGHQGGGAAGATRTPHPPFLHSLLGDAGALEVSMAGFLRRIL